MPKKQKKSPQKKGTFASLIENLRSLNHSKFFAGIVMLTVNIGSKHITIDISKSQEAYVKYTLGRQILIFAILWMGTRYCHCTYLDMCLHFISRLSIQ